MNVLFVCLGNICRSPSAEGILDKMIMDANLQDQVQTDSAGTSSYHAGSLADPRAREVAKTKGYTLKSTSRQFTTQDFENFDIIITMDDSNYKNVTALASNQAHIDKVKPMTSFCSIYEKKYSEVPDPYYGGIDDYETVYDICEDACAGLLKFIQQNLPKHSAGG